jgi:ribosome-associated toxin RatA of RatAB toxin-antitoxin module
MQHIYRSALVPHSAQQMYQLIDDIDSYHQFVPYVQSTQIIERTQNQVTAEMKVAKSGFAKSFTTKNTLTPFGSIRMDLIDGPFKHLSGDWKLTELSDTACKIELDIEFEFSNKLASLAFSSIFNQLVQSMVSAFTERAEQVYGK